MLHVITWIWGTKYSQHGYVDKLQGGVARNLTQPYRWCVLRPSFEDERLTEIPGCFARLRMFDPAWQQLNQMFPGDRIVCLDLDMVITGKLDPAFDRDEDFVILQGANSKNPNPMNGSVMMLRAGAHPEIWSEFNLDEAMTSVPVYAFPDDQGWLWHKLPQAAGWKVGPESGIYAFQKPQWPKGNALPADARIVAFPGWRDPSKYVHLDWVKEHWQ